MVLKYVCPKIFSCVDRNRGEHVFCVEVYSLEADGEDQVFQFCSQFYNVFNHVPGFVVCDGAEPLGQTLCQFITWIRIEV